MTEHEKCLKSFDYDPETDILSSKRKGYEDLRSGGDTQ